MIVLCVGIYVIGMFDCVLLVGILSVLFVNVELLNLCRFRLMILWCIVFSVVVIFLVVFNLEEWCWL